jgi:hypothetical protein
VPGVQRDTTAPKARRMPWRASLALTRSEICKSLMIHIDVS